ATVRALAGVASRALAALSGPTRADALPVRRSLALLPTAGTATRTARGRLALGMTRRPAARTTVARPDPEDIVGLDLRLAGGSSGVPVVPGALGRSIAVRGRLRSNAATVRLGLYRARLCRRRLGSGLRIGWGGRPGRSRRFGMPGPVTFKRRVGWRH